MGVHISSSDLCPMTKVISTGPRYTAEEIEVALPRAKPKPKPMLVQINDVQITSEHLPLIDDAATYIAASQPMLWAGKWDAIKGIGKKQVYPFDRISAYKVRESRDNLQHNLKTVGSISEYQRARPCDRHSGILLGCVEDDMACRLKRVPEIIAREFGYNLIPAIEALRLEGVPLADIANFIRSIQPQVDQLLTECDVVQTATARSIKSEYEAMKAGRSGMERICTAALSIGEGAAEFCGLYGV